VVGPRQHYGPEWCTTAGVAFELRYLKTDALVHVYRTESAALAFVRDVIRIGGKDRAAGFTLWEREGDGGGTREVASGAALVQRALEDRAQ
jgi:hypothetical protein